jgi:hypothetical protein
MGVSAVEECFINQDEFFSMSCDQYQPVLWCTINLGRPVIGLTSKCYVQLTPFSIFVILVIVTAIIKIKIGKRSVHQSEMRTTNQLW